MNKRKLSLVFAGLTIAGQMSSMNVKERDLAIAIADVIVSILNADPIWAVWLGWMLGITVGELKIYVSNPTCRCGAPYSHHDACDCYEPEKGD